MPRLEDEITIVELKKYKMSNYLFLFRGGHEAMEKQSPEELQANMQKWAGWMAQIREKGQLVDGLPLGKQGKVVKKAGDLITDGPFAEGAEIVGGYLIVTAEDLNEAVEISKGCPIYENGGCTEVREIMSMNI